MCLYSGVPTAEAQEGRLRGAMEPTDILKTVPELQKVAAIIVGGIPIAEVVKRIVLPSADALGERMKNRIDRFFEKTGKMVEDAGVTPQPVPEKLLIPLLQGASLEDDEDMHTMWAALLANTASQENIRRVRPGFIAILKQMAPDEAALLNWLYDREDPHECAALSLENLYGELVYGADRGVAYTRLRICIGGLTTVGLIDNPGFEIRREYMFYFESQDGEPNFTTGLPLGFTQRGLDFITACRPPARKGND